jgi:hypothetical protein
MFVFLMNENVGIREPGVSDFIYRGAIVENSEVGAGALKVTRFGFRKLCGNHIIWDAGEVLEVSIRHVGNARNRQDAWFASFLKYMDESASEEEAKVAYARNKLIAATKDEVLDALFGKRSLNLSRKTLEAGFDSVKPSEDGDPRTVWGVVQGLTRYSQTVPYADKRTDIDRAAGRILSFNF